MAAEPAHVASDRISRVKPRAVARIAEIRTRTATPTSTPVKTMLDPSPERCCAPFIRFSGRCQAGGRRAGQMFTESMQLWLFRGGAATVCSNTADEVGQFRVFTHG